MTKAIRKCTGQRRLAQPRCSVTAQKLEIAVAALEDISTLPRGGRAKRLAGAVLRFLENVKPVSMGISRVSPNK